MLLLVLLVFVVVVVGGVWLECGRGAGRSADHSLFFFRVGVRGFESWGFRGYDGRIRKEDGDL